jgi:hypothetical protein
LVCAAKALLDFFQAVLNLAAIVERQRALSAKRQPKAFQMVIVTESYEPTGATDDFRAKPRVQ